MITCKHCDIRIPKTFTITEYGNFCTYNCSIKYEIENNSLSFKIDDIHIIF